MCLAQHTVTRVCAGRRELAILTVSVEMSGFLYSKAPHSSPYFTLPVVQL